MLMFITEGTLIVEVNKLHARKVEELLDKQSGLVLIFDPLALQEESLIETLDGNVN